MSQGETQCLRCHAKRVGTVSTLRRARKAYAQSLAESNKRRKEALARDMEARVRQEESGAAIMEYIDSLAG